MRGCEGQRKQLVMVTVGCLAGVRLQLFGKERHSTSVQRRHFNLLVRIVVVAFASAKDHRLKDPLYPGRRKQRMKCRSRPEWKDMGLEL